MPQIKMSIFLGASESDFPFHPLPMGAGTVDVFRVNNSAEYDHSEPHICLMKVI
jgi:hypothetical protein